MRIDPVPAFPREKGNSAPRLRGDGATLCLGGSPNAKATETANKEDHTEAEGFKHVYMGSNRLALYERDALRSSHGVR